MSSLPQDLNTTTTTSQISGFYTAKETFFNTTTANEFSDVECRFENATSELSETGRLICAVYLSFVTFFGILNNSILIIVLLSNHELRFKISNWLLMCLNFFDFGVSAFQMPVLIEGFLGDK